ncbi:hypothetical protein NC652_018966 [Populus alba x Populus x berolinensis]|nr:hypothetical protein NC652_018966 [Populus alba x Populus x berolinensis]
MVCFQEESKACNWRPKIEELPPQSIESISLSVQPPKHDLKLLPFNLKYSFLGENETFPIIISSKLNAHQECKLLQTLKMHKNALGWTIADIKGISPLICTHRIYLNGLNNVKKPLLNLKACLVLLLSFNLLIDHYLLK